MLHPNLIQKSTRDRLGWLGSSRKTQGPHTFRLALLKFIVHLVLKGIESYLLTAVEFDPHNDQFFQDKLLCFDALLFFIILWGVWSLTWQKYTMFQNHHKKSHISMIFKHLNFHQKFDTTQAKMQFLFLLFSKLFLPLKKLFISSKLSLLSKTYNKKITVEKICKVLIRTKKVFLTVKINFARFARITINWYFLH